MPLQVKINNFSLSELDIFPWTIEDATAQIDIGSNDGKFFIKCKEIWNKINELMDIDNPNDFVEIDYYGEFIILDVEKNASDIIDKYRKELVFVFTSVFNNFPHTSLVQYRY